MRIIDLLLDSFIDTRLFEMAHERKKVIEFVSNLQFQLALHLVKIFYYDSPVNVPHWCAEVDAWLTKIDVCKLKGNKKLQPEVYYKLLFEEPLGEHSDIEGLIKYAGKVDGMKTIAPKATVAQVQEKCEKLLHRVSHDIANGKYRDLNDYLDEMRLL